MISLDDGLDVDFFWVITASMTTFSESDLHLMVSRMHLCFPVQTRTRIRYVVIVELHAVRSTVGTAGNSTDKS